MKVRFHPRLSEERRIRVEELDLQSDPEAAVGLTEVGLDLPREDEEAQEPIAWIALIDQPEQAAEALAAGAVATVTFPPDPRLLELTVQAHRSLARQWRRRTSAQQRQARRAMDDLARTQDLLGRLIDATPNPVMAVDTSGRVLVFNRAAELALGYDSAYARSQMHVTHIYAQAEDARRVQAELSASPERMVTGLAVRLRARWGENIPVSLSAAEVRDAHGELVATVGVFLDQREPFGLRAQIEEFREQLIAAEHRSAAINKAVEAVFEVNQPLTALMGTIELMEMEPDLDERTRQRLARAQGQLVRIRDAIRAFGNLTQLEVGASATDGRMKELLRQKP